MVQQKISKSTIMFTDIVGYSSMVGKDESAALNLLDEHNNIIFPIIKKYEGVIIKLIGDAIFARFPSSKNSLYAATKIQNILSERNSVSQKDKGINIRIGLHSGKVIEKDDDLFGHDVNLCSRIEAISPQGGIAASAQLLESIDNNDFLYREMGFIKLKNIAEPHQIYKIYIDKDDYESETDKQLQKQIKNNGINIVDISSYSIEEIFSIAVLYITNLGIDKDESIAYNLTESLIDDLGYFNSIRLANFQDIQRFKQSDLKKDDIARKLSVKYILQGSILKEDQNIKLSFELIDIDTGIQLWENNWSDTITHLKGIQKTILDAIISNFNLEFPKELLDYYSEEMSQNANAIEEYNAGKYCMDFLKEDKDIETSIAHFDKAISLDSNFVEAYYMLSNSKKRLGYYEDAENALNKGESIAKSKNNLHGLSYIYRGYKSLYTSLGKYDKAKEYILKALKTHLQLSHLSFETFLRIDYANCLNNLNHPDLSIEQTKLAIELLEKVENERWLGISYGNLNSTYLTLGDYTKSIEYGLKGLAIFKKTDIAHNTATMMLWLAETYYRTGQYELMQTNILESEKILTGLNEHFREAKIEYFKGHYALYKNDKNLFLEHIDICIEKYNLAQNTVFEVNALIDKLYIQLEASDNAKTSLTISKIESIKKRIQGLSDNAQYNSMIYYNDALKGQIDRDKLDTFKDDLLNDKEILKEYNIWIAIWFIARTYNYLNEHELYNACHKKAKQLMEIFSKNSSGEKERQSFIDVYFNKRILDDIRINKIEEIQDTKLSVFAFCPSCGFKNENNFAFCPSCGNNLKQ